MRLGWGFFGLLDWRTAKWALGLRAALGPVETDNDLARHISFATAYTWRDREAEILDKTIDTADLDGYVMFRCWETREGFRQYKQAVADGKVPAFSLSSMLKTLERIYPGSIETHVILMGHEWDGMRIQEQTETLSPELKDQFARRKEALLRQADELWSDAEIREALKPMYEAWKQAKAQKGQEVVK